MVGVGRVGAFAWVRGCRYIYMRTYGGRHVGGVRLFVQPKRVVVSAPTSFALVVRRSAQSGEAGRGLFRSQWLLFNAAPDMRTCLR